MAVMLSFHHSCLERNFGLLFPGVPGSPTRFVWLWFSAHTSLACFFRKWTPCILLHNSIPSETKGSKIFFLKPSVGTGDPVKKLRLILSPARRASRRLYRREDAQQLLFRVWAQSV